MTGFLLSRIALCNSSIGRPTRPRPPYPSSFCEPLERAELSPPEQKARSPAPASTMTPTSGSLSASRIASSISSTVSAECVQHLRPVDCDRRDAVALVVEDVPIGHAVLLRRVRVPPGRCGGRRRQRKITRTEPAKAPLADARQ